MRTDEEERAFVERWRRRLRAEHGPGVIVDASFAAKVMRANGVDVPAVVDIGLPAGFVAFRHATEEAAIEWATLNFHCGNTNTGWYCLVEGGCLAIYDIRCQHPETWERV